MSDLALKEKGPGIYKGKSSIKVDSIPGQRGYCAVLGIGNYYPAMMASIVSP